MSERKLTQLDDDLYFLFQSVYSSTPVQFVCDKVLHFADVVHSLSDFLPTACSDQFSVNCWRKDN